jgi:hypothetical protein
VRSEWTVLETTKVLGSFEEFEWALCIRRNANHWELAVCVEAQISEIPDDWYDEETGELKAEYQDGTGCLQLPIEVDGVIATGYDGLYLLGGLSAHPNYGVIELVELSSTAVELALAHFEGLFSVSDNIMKEIRACACEPGSHH